jgi:hypothetical protein
MNFAASTGPAAWLPQFALPGKKGLDCADLATPPTVMNDEFALHSERAVSHVA